MVFIYEAVGAPRLASWSFDRAQLPERWEHWVRVVREALSVFRIDAAWVLQRLDGPGHLAADTQELLLSVDFLGAGTPALTAAQELFAYGLASQRAAQRALAEEFEAQQRTARRRAPGLYAQRMAAEACRAAETARSSSTAAAPTPAPAPASGSAPEPEPEPAPAPSAPAARPRAEPEPIVAPERAPAAGEQEQLAALGCRWRCAVRRQVIIGSADTDIDAVGTLLDAIGVDEVELQLPHRHFVTGRSLYGERARHWNSGQPVAEAGEPAAEAELEAADDWYEGHYAAPENPPEPAAQPGAAAPHAAPAAPPASAEAVPAWRGLASICRTLYRPELRSHLPAGLASLLAGAGAAVGLAVQQAYSLPGGGHLFISHGSVVEASVDAIVNAANTLCLGGGGVDGAIATAGGEALLNARSALPVLSGGVRCHVGGAVVTSAGGTLRCGHVIHAVGPDFREHRDDICAAELLLLAAYEAVLARAREMGARSIAVPILCGAIFRGPQTLSRMATLAAYALFSHAYPGLESVYLVGYTEREARVLGVYAPLLFSEARLADAAAPSEAADSNSHPLSERAAALNRAEALQAPDEDEHGRQVSERMAHQQAQIQRQHEDVSAALSFGLGDDGTADDGPADGATQTGAAVHREAIAAREASRRVDVHREAAAFPLGHTLLPVHRAAIGLDSVPVVPT